MPAGIGCRFVTDPPVNVDTSELADWVKGRVGGPAAVGWIHGRHLLQGGAEVCRIGATWWLPGFGMLVDHQGHAPVSPVGELRHNWPMLDPVPDVSRTEGSLSFSPPRDVEQFGVSTVALPWGMSNYGHFILDGLAAILAVEEIGLLAHAPLLVPHLNRWQRALIATAFGDIPVREVRAQIVALEGAVFSTAMDHFLHTPGPLTLRLRDHLRGRLPEPRRSGRRLYISRRYQHMRVMVDEEALEAELANRGFEIIRPETLCVVDQLTLFGEASVIVGASGAGLSNLLLCQPGVKVIEIQPENFTSFWVGALCRTAGLDWSCYVCQSPGPSAKAPWLARLRRGFQFAYQLDVPAFADFLGGRLREN
jgi:capsular polysaccharide biosynthesis protein